MTARDIINAVAGPVGTVIGGPFGALFGAVVSQATKPTGVKNKLGDAISKAPLQSTTILGGVSLAALIPLWNQFSALVDQALPWPQAAAAAKVVIVVYLLGVVINGRKKASERPPVG